MFPSPKIDLSVGVQTVSRAPFLSLHFQVFDRRKARTKALRIGRVIVVDVRGQSSQSTGTNDIGTNNTNSSINVIGTNNTNSIINVISTNNTNSTISVIGINNTDNAISVIGTNNIDSTISVICTNNTDSTISVISTNSTVLASLRSSTPVTDLRHRARMLDKWKEAT